MPTKAPKRHESTVIDRTKIIELSAQGFSQRDIATMMNMSKSGVFGVLRRWKSGQLQSAPRTGRPTKLAKRDKRRIIRASDANPNASLQELTTELDLRVCFETVGRTLRATGRYVRWARHKPFISEKNRRNRIFWARSQRHTSIEQWKRRIFTDEIHIELSPRGMKDKSRG